MSAVASRVAVVGGVAVAGGATAALVWLATQYARAGSIAHVMRRSPAMSGGRYTLDALVKLNRDTNELRFVDGSGVPSHVNGNTRVVRSIPTTARRVPLLPPTRTPLVPQGFNRLTGNGRKTWVLAVRDTLRASGHGDIDARIIAQRWAVETFWDLSCQGHNHGNIKAQGFGVYVESWDTLVREQQVWLNNIPEAVGVHGIVDRVNSADFYPQFASASDYMRFFMRTVGRMGDAVAQARRGGIDGARGFAAALARAGYSPGSVEAHVGEMVGYWNNSARMVGAQWESLR